MSAHLNPAHARRELFVLAHEMAVHVSNVSILFDKMESFYQVYLFVIVGNLSLGNYLSPCFKLMPFPDLRELGSLSV